MFYFDEAYLMIIFSREPAQLFTGPRASIVARRRPQSSSRPLDYLWACSRWNKCSRRISVVCEADSVRRPVSRNSSINKINGPLEKINLSIISDIWKYVCATIHHSRWRYSEVSMRHILGWAIIPSRVRVCDLYLYCIRQSTIPNKFLGMFLC